MMRSDGDVLIEDYIEDELKESGSEISSDNHAVSTDSRLLEFIKGHYAFDAESGELGKILQQTDLSSEFSTDANQEALHEALEKYSPVPAEDAIDTITLEAHQVIEHFVRYFTGKTNQDCLPKLHTLYETRAFEHHADKISADLSSIDDRRLEALNTLKEIYQPNDETVIPMSEDGYLHITNTLGLASNELFSIFINAYGQRDNIRPEIQKSCGSIFDKILSKHYKGDEKATPVEGSHFTGQLRSLYRKAIFTLAKNQLEKNGDTHLPKVLSFVKKCYGGKFPLEIILHINLSVRDTSKTFLSERSNIDFPHTKEEQENFLKNLVQKCSLVKKGKKLTANDVSNACEKIKKDYLSLLQQVDITWNSDVLKEIDKHFNITYFQTHLTKITETTAVEEEKTHTKTPTKKEIIAATMKDLTPASVQTRYISAYRHLLESSEMSFQNKPSLVKHGVTLCIVLALDQRTPPLFKEIYPFMKVYLNLLKLEATGDTIDHLMQFAGLVINKATQTEIQGHQLYTMITPLDEKRGSTYTVIYNLNSEVAKRIKEIDCTAIHSNPIVTICNNNANQLFNHGKAITYRTDESKNDPRIRLAAYLELVPKDRPTVEMKLISMNFQLCLLLGILAESYWRKDRHIAAELNKFRNVFAHPVSQIKGDAEFSIVTTESKEFLTFASTFIDESKTIEQKLSVLSPLNSHAHHLAQQKENKQLADKKKTEPETEYSGEYSNVDTLTPKTITYLKNYFTTLEKTLREKTDHFEKVKEMLPEKDRSVFQWLIEDTLKSIQTLKQAYKKVLKENIKPAVWNAYAGLRHPDLTVDNENAVVPKKK